jgi:hypothetical protein
MHEHDDSTDQLPEAEPLVAEYRSLSRALAQDFATYRESLAQAAGPATLAGLYVGAVKIRDALTKDDEPPQNDTKE